MAIRQPRTSPDSGAPTGGATPDAPLASAPVASHGRRGGAPAMLARASAQAGVGAGALFARLDAANADSPQSASLPQGRAEAARLLERWGARIAAGEWNAGVADLVAMAEALERASAPVVPPHRA